MTDEPEVVRIRDPRQLLQQLIDKASRSTSSYAASYYSVGQALLSSGASGEFRVEALRAALAALTGPGSSMLAVHARNLLPGLIRDLLARGGGSPRKTCGRSWRSSGRSG